MRKARFWGLLWMSIILELQEAANSEEMKYTLTVGQTLSVSCPFNVMKHFSSRKAWQRLTDGGEPLTLVVTERGSGSVNEVHVGRYFLEEIPIDGILHVRMTNLQVEDSGLYRCVIYPPSKNSSLLHHPIRLVVTKDPASGNNPTQNLAEISTFPPITTEVRGKLRTRPRTVTQRLPTSTTSLSSPGLGVNPTRGTGVSGISVISIVTIVVCGILSKSLVFTVLLFVTQRSFGL